ncbi:hypothetical protein ACOI1C_15900 [Bacillus sp. DJP31]|uniref:hypothetical protein n=1 Tax=Bacillus sp. DJP31 TaxID=3409789 RepID=UPI003BB677A1
MTKENKESYQFYYEEVGEKEIMEQMTDAYQSGEENSTVEQQNDRKLKAIFENKAF